MTSVAVMAGELVERARRYDQNAMAMLACIRDNAKRGMPRAQDSMRHINAYIQKKPYRTPVEIRTAGFGYDIQVPRRAILLANRVRLTPERVKSLSASFGAEMSRTGAPATAVQRGQRILRQAIRLQALRQQDSRFSDFHPVLGWEFGE